MILISQAKHPDHRSMTLIAALATFLDNIQPGPNVVPVIYDDVKRGGEVPVKELQMRIKSYYKNHLYVTRTINGQLVVYPAGE